MRLCCRDQTDLDISTMYYKSMGFSPVIEGASLVFMSSQMPSTGTAALSLGQELRLNSPCRSRRYHQKQRRGKGS